MVYTCAFCEGNGFHQQLPRLKPTWGGWKSTPPHDGSLQMMSDTDGIYFLCNDCQITYAFLHWVMHGVWEMPNVRV
jgi:hypothetical protein